MRNFIIYLIFLCLLYGEPILVVQPLWAESPYAVEVVCSEGPFGGDPYDDPQSVLGRPTIWNPDCKCVSMVSAAWGTDENGNKVIVTLNSGSYIIVKFDHWIKNDPNNRYGSDFIVFGNAFYAADQPVNESTDMEECHVVNGNPFAEPVYISVSQDGINWYDYSSPTADSNYPTNGRKWNREDHKWGDTLDFTKPVDPSLGPSNFAGKSVADAIDSLYKDSGGGTGFDLELSGYDSILYIKVHNSNGGEIDAFADVSSDEPTGVELIFFTGTSFNGRVNLRWRTESEINTYEWIIVRSTEGNGGYKEIVRIKSQGSTPLPREYFYADIDVSHGITYDYKLGNVSTYNNTIWYGPVVVKVYNMLSTRVKLSQSYPNPFSSSTTIYYTLPSITRVNLKVYDIAGRCVRTLINERQETGQHKVKWDGTNEEGERVVCGVYFYKLEVKCEKFKVERTKKMVVVPTSWLR